MSVWDKILRNPLTKKLGGEVVKLPSKVKNSSFGQIITKGFSGISKRFTPEAGKKLAADAVAFGKANITGSVTTGAILSTDEIISAWEDGTITAAEAASLVKSLSLNTGLSLATQGGLNATKQIARRNRVVRAFGIKNPNFAKSRIGKLANLTIDTGVVIGTSEVANLVMAKQSAEKDAPPSTQLIDTLSTNGSLLSKIDLTSTSVDTMADQALLEIGSLSVSSLNDEHFNLDQHAGNLANLKNLSDVASEEGIDSSFVCFSGPIGPITLKKALVTLIENVISNGLTYMNSILPSEAIVLSKSEKSYVTKELSDIVAAQLHYYSRRAVITKDLNSFALLFKLALVKALTHMALISVFPNADHNFLDRNFSSTQNHYTKADTKGESFGDISVPGTLISQTQSRVAAAVARGFLHAFNQFVSAYDVMIVKHLDFVFPMNAILELSDHESYSGFDAREFCLETGLDLKTLSYLIFTNSLSLSPRELDDVVIYICERNTPGVSDRCLLHYSLLETSDMISVIQNIDVSSVTDVTTGEITSIKKPVATFSVVEEGLDEDGLLSRMQEFCASFFDNASNAQASALYHLCSAAEGKEALRFYDVHGSMIIPGSSVIGYRNVDSINGMGVAHALANGSFAHISSELPTNTNRELLLMYIISGLTNNVVGFTTNPTENVFGVINRPDILKTVIDTLRSGSHEELFSRALHPTEASASYFGKFLERLATELEVIYTNPVSKTTSGGKVYSNSARKEISAKLAEFANSPDMQIIHVLANIITELKRNVAHGSDDAQFVMDGDIAQYVINHFVSTFK